MSTVKVSELSAFNTTDQNIYFSYALVLDTSNTIQDAEGSVIISPISSIRAEFWATSSNTLTSLYSTVSTNSAVTWNYQGVDVKTLSSNWQSTYSTVNTNSAVTWNYQGIDVKALSSDWQSTYTTVNTNSASTWVALDGTKLPLSGGDVTGPISISAGTITNIPLTQIILTATYVSTLSDAGKHFYHPASDNNPRTFTIDSHASVPYPLGTTLTFINDINTVSIEINSDTLALAGGAEEGTRTLSSVGIATAIKVTDGRWVIAGSNIS